MITADHGNAEQLIHPETGDIDKEHTTNPVPLILVDNQRRRATPLTHAKQTVLGLSPIGLLADVAPTILELLGQPKPDDMTGESLLPELR
jgi:2,3-bisphosphoglycerate-independent phosphoglycerate mutase